MVDPNAPVMTGIVPYVSVEGASDASALYQTAFGATELARMPAEDGKRLMHCCLEIHGGPLMMSDCFPEYGHILERSSSFVMHLQVADADLWWNRAVAAGLEVTMPLEKQFWGDRYGKLRDRFGVTWSIAERPKDG